MYSIAETMDEIERGVDFGEFETLWQTLKVAVLTQQTNNTQSKPCPACGGHTIMAPYCSVCQEAWDI